MSRDKMDSGSLDSELPESNSEAAENDPILVLTQDLQRLQADFQNYRKRVDKERVEAQDLATIKLLKQLLPTLDDIDRARGHGELEGGFKAVANSLLSMTTNLGLKRFEDVKVPFDPNVHEALVHERSSEVSRTEVTKVLRSGYSFKDTVIRPSQVVVSDPIN